MYNEGQLDGYVTERPEGVSASSANSNFAMVEFEEGFVTSAEDTAISVGVEKNSEFCPSCGTNLHLKNFDDNNTFIFQPVFINSI